MTPNETIKTLLADASQAAARQAVRAQWAEQITKDFFAAQERAGEAWKRIFATLPDDLDDEELEKLPGPPEQAEADALYAQIEAVRDHDRWPRELYWKNV